MVAEREWCVVLGVLVLLSALSTLCAWEVPGCDVVDIASPGAVPALGAVGAMSLSEGVMVGVKYLRVEPGSWFAVRALFAAGEIVSFRQSVFIGFLAE